MPKPRVFISYSHDSEEHKQRVMAFAKRLHASGSYVIIDQEASPTVRWSLWCETQIEEADFVLCICTETYQQRAKGKAPLGQGHGAMYEADLIRQELYEGGVENRKFLPVVLTEADANYFPKMIRGYDFFTVDQETEYARLCGVLLAQLQAHEDGPVWNIPDRNEFFTGRGEYLEALHGALDKRSVAALWGLGGIGKSQTAIEYAHCFRKEYRAGFWVVADSEDNLVSGFGQLADILSLGTEKEITKQAEAAKRWMEGNPDWLLILDNVEDWKVASKWIPVGRRGRVLVTTRLQSSGKIAEGIELLKMTPTEGADFLLRRAKVKNPTDDDRRTAQEISQELGGLALALEQAGAFVEEMRSSLKEYLVFYRTEGPKLRARVGEDQDRASATVTFTRAFEKLTPAAQDLVRLCAFLASDAIPEEILTGGAEADLQIVETIREASRFSLLQRVSDKKIEIHRLVQHVIRDGMDQSVQRAVVERAMDSLNRVFPFVKFETWSQCERLLPHARATVGWMEHFNIESAGWRLLNQTAFYLQDRAQFDDAETLYRRALEGCEQALGKEHPDTLSSVNNLGSLLQDKGDLEGAETLYRRALKGWERALGKEHPDTLRSVNNLGYLLRTKGFLAGAEPLLRRALEGHERVSGKEHPDTLNSVNNLASLLQDQGDLEGAEALYRRALLGNERVLGKEHPDTLRSVNNLGSLLRAKGDLEGAEPLYRRALEGRERVLGREHPDTLQSLNNLGSLLQAKGELEGAEPLIRRALLGFRSALGENHPNTRIVAENLMILLEKIRQPPPG